MTGCVDRVCRVLIGCVSESVDRVNSYLYGA